MSLVRRIAALFGRKPKLERSYFKGAELSRLTQDWVTSPLSADDELRSDIRRLRSRSRELARNSPIIRQYLTSLTVNVIGPTGFTHQADVRSMTGRQMALVNDQMEEAWEAWCESVTLDGRLNITRLQHQLLAAVARDGEVFVRVWRVRKSVNAHAIALEAIDADQLDERLVVAKTGADNEIRMGVEIDDYGRPVAYHMWDRPESFVAHPVPRKRVRVPASEVIHLYDPERVNQTRGVPWTAAVMMPLRMLEGYVEAELVAARTAAAKMGFFVRKEGLQAGSVNADENGIITTEANPGSFDFAPDGYELQQWNPDHPNAVFPEFVKGAMRQIATGLRMSYNALANDLEGVNYSSMRSGMLIERDVYKVLQEWWRCAFLEPVYRAWCEQAIMSGALRVDAAIPFPNITKAKFIGRGWPWVDPLKDAQAGELAIANGLTSRTRLLATQGLDLETVLRELAEEQEMAESMGVQLKPLTGGSSAPAQPTPDEDEEDDEEEGEEDDAEAEDENEPEMASEDEDSEELRQLTSYLSSRRNQ